MKGTGDVDRFGAAWERLEEQTASEQLFGGGYDLPLLALLKASRNTTLRRWYPFTSMNRLCLAGSPFPFEDLQPCHIEFYPGGRYRVMRGAPYPSDEVAPVDLETTDADTAIAAAIRVLHTNRE